MKHAAAKGNWSTVEPTKPKHSAGWTYGREYDDINRRRFACTPGKHAKPFGKHHPATPVTPTTSGWAFTTITMDAAA